MRRPILEMGVSIDGFVATDDGVHDWGHRGEDGAAQALSRERLVDEYRLVVRPAALGSGLPLFKDLRGSLYLELIDVRPFPSGAVLHVYRPRPG